jgi:hypothetical protein
MSTVVAPSGMKTAKFTMSSIIDQAALRTMASCSDAVKVMMETLTRHEIFACRAGKGAC